MAAASAVASRPGTEQDQAQAQAQDSSTRCVPSMRIIGPREDTLPFMSNDGIVRAVPWVLAQRVVRKGIPQGALTAQRCRSIHRATRNNRKLS